MSSLLAVISPAKLLDDKTHYPDINCSHPEFLTEADLLAKKLVKMKAPALGRMLEVSKTIAETNVKRYAEWSLPLSHLNAFPAIYMFRGDVYRGIDANTLTSTHIEFANKNLKILSGLYGVLKPLDFVLPYRLMMGSPFAYSAKQKNLYQFWGNKVTDSIAKDLDPKGVLINIASEEYFGVINEKALNRKVIHCEFREQKGDKFVITSTYAKLARGKMARFFIENAIDNPADLKAFNVDRYGFNAALSSDSRYIFTR